MQTLGAIMSVYSDFGCIFAYRLRFDAKSLHLIFAKQARRNNVLILQFDTPWVSEEAKLSIYTDIFRILSSGNIFGHNSIIGGFPQ